MKYLSFIAAFIVVSLALGSPVHAQTLSVVSGNGQVVQENFLTAEPFVVQAKDSTGRPAPGIAVNWSVTQGSGTLPNPMTITDANGFATANFVGPNLQAGPSFLAATVTVTSALTAVNFVVTTVPVRQAGGQAAPPLVELVTPRTVTGPAGSTVAGAVMVRVTALSGVQVGQGVPNVGVQILNDPDPANPTAMCNGPAGVVLTDSKGLATCDLVLGRQTGNGVITVSTGGSLTRQTISLQVTPGAACSFILSATTQTFGAAGGNGTVSVGTPTGCAWTAVSNASWITINFGASNSTNANVGYTVAPDTGAARAGAIVIAGQTYTVNQSGTVAGGGGAVMIVTGSNLPAATVGIPYAATFAATGGQLPYVWSANALPPGFSLNGTTGTLIVTPSSVGTLTFAITVTDALGQSKTQAFSLGVLSSATSLTITTPGLPSGVIGQAYQQPLTSAGGCVTPFAPVPVFSITGGALPSGLTLQQPGGGSFTIAGTPTGAGVSNFTLTVKDACGSLVSAPFSLTVLSSVGPAMVVTPATLAFSVQIGGPTLPADQTLTITSNGVAVPYSATASTTTGGNWLAVTNPAGTTSGTTSGTTPGTLTVSVVNYGQLAIGTYLGAVTITSGASNSPVVVPVSLVVSGPSILTVSPTRIAFTQSFNGSGLTQQAITVTSGGAAIHFTATANTLSGGSWLSLNMTAGDTPATLIASINSAGLTPGTYNGTIVIGVAGTGSQAISVSLTVPALGALSASPAALTYSALLGGINPSAKPVTLTSSAGGSTYTATVFTANGGDWLSVVPQVGVTPTSVSVIVNSAALDLGSYRGTITVVSSDLTLMPVIVPVSLTVGQPGPVLRAITNAASFAPGPIAPGELVTIFGASLGPATLATAQLDANGNIASQNAGTQVFFDGLAAPIIYTSDAQAAAIVPYDVFGRDTVEVHVGYLGAISNSIILRIADSSPAIFMQQTPAGQGAILNQDGSINLPQTGAAPGSFVSLYATGEGQTSPQGVNGKILTSIVLPRPRLPVTVQVAGLQVEVLYAGGAPGLAAGVLQVNVHLPDNLPRGIQVPVVLTVGNQSSPPVLLSTK